MGILVTTLLILTDRQRKELSIFTTWKPGDPTRSSDGRTIIPTRRFVVRLINSGKVPILPSDFERPANLYAPDCQILDATITDTKPDNIHPKATIEDGEIVLSPILLNPGDSITFKAISTFVRFRQRVYLDCRITGVRKVRRLGFVFGCAPLTLGLLGGALSLGPFIVAAWLTESGQVNLLADFENYAFYSCILGVMLQFAALYGHPWIRAILAEELKTKLEKFSLWLLSLTFKIREKEREKTNHR